VAGHTARHCALDAQLVLQPAPGLTIHCTILTSDPLCALTGSDLRPQTSGAAGGDFTVSRDEREHTLLTGEKSLSCDG
jgi:hypothetical protein